MSDVRAWRDGATRRLTLERPKAIHALTREMCEAMNEALIAWRNDPEVRAVILDHAEGTRGFCAGGDVSLVRSSALEDGGAAGRDFFFTEYRLNHLLFTYDKPVIAFLDGITMGGGVGIGMPAPYRVATENTRFAMPEGAIGLFPDVGAGWYLPRLLGEVGKFLALTGARLDGAECLWAGIATHYLPAERLEEAKARIAAQPNAIEAVLGEFSVKPAQARLADNAEKIDRLFAADALEEILAALGEDGSDWAAAELDAVRGKCPTSAKVALRQMSEGAKLDDFGEEMVREYRIAARMMMRADFAEGVRAVLIDKDNAARWDPPSPAGVDEEMLDAIFAPLPAHDEWTPLNPS